MLEILIFSRVKNAQPYLEILRAIFNSLVIKRLCIFSIATAQCGFWR